VRLTYFHANRLLFGLYKQETEILRRKDDGNICFPTLLIFHWSLPLSDAFIQYPTTVFSADSKKKYFRKIIFNIDYMLKMKDIL